MMCSDNFRYIFAVLCFFVYYNILSTRNTLNLAIVEMVKKSPHHHHFEQQTPLNVSWSPDGGQFCPFPNTSGQKSYHHHGGTPEDMKLDWSPTDVSFALGVWFGGRAFTEILVGPLIDRIGPKLILSLAQLLGVITTMFAPVIARASYAAFLVSQSLNGACLGVLNPSFHALLARWEPETERGRLATIMYSASAAGTAGAVLLTGFVLHSFVWDAIFYLIGAFQLLTLIPWIIFAKDNPLNSPYVTEGEKELLRKHCKINHQVDRKVRIAKIPFFKMMTSIPFLVCVFANVAYLWSRIFFMTQLPQYVKYVLHQEVLTNAIMNAFPFLAKFLMSHLTACVLGYISSRGWLNKIQTMKAATTFALTGTAVMTMLITSVGCDIALAAVMFICADAPSGAHLMGAWNNAVDLAPNYAATLMGINGFFQYFTAMLIPYITVAVVGEDLSNMHSWSRIFNVSAAFFLVANVVYVALGTSKEQEWNALEPEDEVETLLKEDNDKM